MQRNITRTFLLLAMLLGTLTLSLAQTTNTSTQRELVVGNLFTFTLKASEFTFLSQYEVSQTEGTQAYFQLTEAFNRQFSNQFYQLMEQRPFSRSADTSGAFLVVSMLYYDAGFRIGVKLLKHQETQIQTVWISEPLGPINAQEIVPQAAARLWQHLSSRRKEPPARPACFELKRFPEFSDGLPMIGSRLRPPLRQITYAGPPKWMLRHSPETLMYYPVLLTAGMAVVVDESDEVRYNPGESSRWVSLDKCSPQERLQGLAYGVIHDLSKTEEAPNAALAGRDSQ